MHLKVRMSFGFKPQLQSAGPFWTPTYKTPPADLRSEVLQDRGTVHGSRGTDPSVARSASLQMSVDAAHGKLKDRPSGWEAPKSLVIIPLRVTESRVTGVTQERSIWLCYQKSGLSSNEQFPGSVICPRKEPQIFTPFTLLRREEKAEHHDPGTHSEHGASQPRAEKPLGAAPTACPTGPHVVWGSLIPSRTSLVGLPLPPPSWAPAPTCLAQFQEVI